MRQFVWGAVLISLHAASAYAAPPNPRTEVRNGLVSVLTDGIVDPGGRATQAINQLAYYASHLANIRVLPIACHGAVANVRNFLYLPAVDLPSLHTDVLTFLDHA